MTNRQIYLVSSLVGESNRMNNYATSAKDLGEGLTKAASSMENAGTGLEKTLAMLTGGSEITQDAGEFGNFLKVASMRIRGKIMPPYKESLYAVCA